MFISGQERPSKSQNRGSMLQARSLAGADFIDKARNVIGTVLKPFMRSFEKRY